MTTNITSQGETLLTSHTPFEDYVMSYAPVAIDHPIEPEFQYPTQPLE